MKMGKLDNKIADVTGSSKGIGAAIAKQFGAEGASFVVNYSSDKQGVDKTVAVIKSVGGNAILVHADLAIEQDVTKLFEETKKHFGRVDILVCL
jgi:3-oxoacyl-[acyl-carrier protein] reductase